ncbi:Photosystem II CP47 chlorophyll apoprotein [Quillaja saponaria]|uniref:Photosystem II CP47 chlorophyll apoprotein n=1 Tax=Quillaja saponaria TaxID=32244 RepID=A0AAD7LHL9_QUISA|nr:Photosystem II CP47 chlorophyll apoprotein [Quillaja saponaria]
MASEQKRDEDMDSLFEGMVLFNPSQLVADHRPDHQEDDDDKDRFYCGQSDASTMSTAVASSSQPLDENLFSDLTLVVNPLQNLEVPESDIDPGSQFCRPSPYVNSPDTTASTPTITTRQVSKKKKRAGLRIGYGRDIILSDDSTTPGSPLPQLPISIPNAGNNSTPEPLAISQDSKTPSVASLSMTHIVVAPPPSDVFSSLYDDSITRLQDAYQKDEDIQQDDDDLNAGTSKASLSEMRFDKIKTQICEKLDRARQLVSSVSATRKDCIKNRRKAADNLNIASLKYVELEKELEEACEAEDFERAERVSENLAAAEQEKQASVNALRDADADIDAFDSKLQQLLDAQIAAEEESAILLENFSKDAANYADLMLKKAAVLSSQEMDKWLSSTEALEAKKMEVEIESHFINEARIELTKSIEHSTQDDKREKVMLCEKKVMLIDEMEKLLALVKQKEMEIAENDSNIRAVEKRIADVVSGFGEMQSCIDARCDNLQSDLSQVNIEVDALSLRKKEIDDLLSREQERGEKLRELATVSKMEAKTYHEVVGLRRNLMLSTLKFRKDKAALANTEEKLSRDVKMFQQEISAARASLQMMLHSYEVGLAVHIPHQMEDKRLPELEAEKKVAAAARNFKEAARIAAEAKGLSLEKDSMQSDMERAISELEKIEEEFGNTVNKMQETEMMILSKERELAVARFKRLRLIASAATAERAAALELGDLEEANLLLAEAEAADLEANKLQPIYNFKVDDITNYHKHFISMELVCYLGRNQLAELAASHYLSAD